MVTNGEESILKSVMKELEDIDKVEERRATTIKVPAVHNSICIDRTLTFRPSS